MTSENLHPNAEPPVKKQKKMSRILILHYIKLTYRSLLFLLGIAFYIYHYPNSSDLIYLGAKETPVMLNIIWLFFAAEMILRLIPSRMESMGCQKQFQRNYLPTEIPSSQADILPRRRTLAVAAAWIGLNSIFAVLYFLNIIDAGILLLIALFYSVCDMICILWFCPFQTWVMKNRCCATCRIYNWDFPMMCTPLIFISSAYTRSLVLLSLIILIKWEWTVHRHPEQFSTRTNRSLSCAMCEEKLCQHKSQLRSFWKKYGQAIRKLDFFQ